MAMTKARERDGVVITELSGLLCAVVGLRDRKKGRAIVVSSSTYVRGLSAAYRLY